MARGSVDQVVKNYLADVTKQTINYHIAKYKISNEILRIAKLDWIENMCIYPAGAQPPINLYYSKPVFEPDPGIQTMLSEPPGAHPEQLQWIELPSEPDSVSALLPIQEQQTYGILRISLSETFFHLMNQVKLGKQGVLYLVKDNVIIYAKERALIGTAMPAINKANIVQESYALGEPGWKLVGVVPQTEILHQIEQFNRIFIVMVTVILAAVMTFAIVAARAILRPLKKIVKGMESIRQGNLDVMLQYQGNDEFSAIIFQFNQMVERVHALIDTIVQQQRHHRETEIVSLLSKLDPHFIYNSLDMIYWKAIMRGEEELGGTIVALSSILRYTISHKNEFVTSRRGIKAVRPSSKSLRKMLLTHAD